jgi:regulator of RNase E activity RraB
MGVDQKAMNRETWAALQQAGFVPGSALEVEVFFFASDESAARSLAGVLNTKGWEANVSSSKAKGLFNRRVEWAVTGVGAITAVQLDVLDAMVDELETFAAAHNCVFDGWGAQIPEP